VLRCGAVFIDEEVADGEALCAPFRYPPEVIAGQFFAPKSSPSGFKSRRMTHSEESIRSGRSLVHSQLSALKNASDFSFFLLFAGFKRRHECDSNPYSRRVTAHRNFRGGSRKTMTASSRCHRHSHIDHARGKQVSGRNLSNENFQLPDTFSSSQNHALFR